MFIWRFALHQSDIPVLELTVIVIIVFIYLFVYLCTVLFSFLMGYRVDFSGPKIHKINE